MEEKKDLGEQSGLSTVKFLLDYCNMNDRWLNPTEIKNDTIATKFENLNEQVCWFLEQNVTKHWL